MQFKEYMHIEKWGSMESEGIEIGTCYVFPKIDGTNSSIWMDDNGEIKAGSRTRQLHLQGDNAGFYNAVLNEHQFDGIKKVLSLFPKLRFYGEFLIPHTLKIYRQEAWRKFYVIDITQEYINEDGSIYEKYLSYEEYKQLCDEYKINYIPCIGIIKNGNYEDFIHLVNTNNYLIEDGKGNGEGIVIKNYLYKNKFGRLTFAKIVTSEFKEKHYKEMGPPEHERPMIEDEIATLFCTQTLIDKTYAKIAIDGWSSKYIPRLLETVYHDLIVEEIYTILKKMNFPTINFKTLRVFVIQKIKQLKPELF
ncbi:MAG: RNA ligase family protein [Nanoarchaeota archaeon]